MTSMNESLENISKKATTSQASLRESQDPWISEEELYTEGSSDDEDDMALRMKRRAKEREREEKLSATHHIRDSEEELVGNIKTKGNSSAQNATLMEEVDQHVDVFSWRPAQGNIKLNQNSKQINPSKKGEEAPSSGPTPSSQTLSEAYSNMHKLDAQLRDSDRRLKEAQAETLREQLSTRAQLRRLREQAGSQNVALSANWDAFMQLCPVVEPGWACATAAGAAERRPRRRRGPGPGPRGDADGATVLPRINGAESDADDSEDSDSSCSALAITDEEKLKLAALLRDVDQDQDQDQELSTDFCAGLASGSGGGYQLDAEVRRSLDHIDGKLQELVPDAAATAGSLSRSALRDLREPRGATRQQRLEDIDRCLQSLADSALEDVEPLGEEEVRSLLQDARAAPGPGPGQDMISAVLEDARRALPRFRYRHDETTGQAPELPRITPEHRGQIMH